MKTLILIMLLNGLAFCQSGSIPLEGKWTTLPYFSKVGIKLNGQEIWRSEWVEDTVFFKGKPQYIAGEGLIIGIDCIHDWVKKDVRPESYISCSVMHDSRGCPDKWGLEEWICRNCLKWVRMKENRIIVEPSKSEFEQLKDKIKELNGHN